MKIKVFVAGGMGQDRFDSLDVHQTNSQVS